MFLGKLFLKVVGLMAQIQEFSWQLTLEKAHSYLVAGAWKTYWCMMRVVVIQRSQQ